MTQEAQALGIPLKFKPADGIGDILCDPDGIQRCLLNLIANALEAGGDPQSPCEAPRVVVSTATPQAGEMVFRVEDTCGGMPAPAQAQALRRFFTTKGSRGTGIGLMLSQKIVAQHGGRLEIDSRWGQGTRVDIWLPVS
ncbi:MAG: HAMP domain-containing sensor histidine kinase [Desulfosarcinaceae bacterium]